MPSSLTFCGLDNCSINKKTLEKAGITVKVSNSPNNNPYTEPTVNVKRGTTGEGARWVQWCLWRFGLLEQSGIDGVIGIKSDAAIKIAQ